MEHAQLLQQAFVDYLKAINPSPWAEDLTDADGNLRISPGEDDALKDGTRIVCAVQGGLQEMPPLSGNRWAEMTVELKTPVVDDGGASLAYHQQNAAALQNALMDTGLVSALRSSSLYVYQVIDRNPYQDADENAWASGMQLRVYSVQN